MHQSTDFILKKKKKENEPLISFNQYITTKAHKVSDRVGCSIENALQ